MRNTTHLFYAVPFFIAILAMSGCRPTGETYSYLQYLCGKKGLGITTMTITLGDGSTDARKLLKSARYDGSYQREWVTVRYPEGCRGTAEEVARAFIETAGLVEQRMGIRWSFPLEIRLVRLPEDVKGIKYSVRLDAHRPLVFPVFIDSECRVLARWAPSVAHEMTEASMIAPLDRRQMVLGDASLGSFCIGTGTRWFRDGVSDRAGDVLGAVLYGDRYQPNSWGYAQLSNEREALLSWENASNAPNLYGAAHALVLEAENSSGENAISQVMNALGHEDIPGGACLRRAFETGSGIRLSEFLANYTIPWLGAGIQDTKPDRANPPLILDGNQAVISSIQPNSPAWRSKLAVGDVIQSLDGTPIRSVSQFRHAIKRHGPGDFIVLCVSRNGETITRRVKLSTEVSIYAAGR